MHGSSMTNTWLGDAGVEGLTKGLRDVVNQARAVYEALKALTKYQVIKESELVGNMGRVEIETCVDNLLGEPFL